ncbi:MAG: FtsQ-type POTRA domain-containing protein [Aliifodinibius sp.]|nr:FtsQ-type POTRA domain-containing protein [Fodinibius sp.]NIV15048.1 FtsQ-type POTRA domain-containing protein [Fodinibius sp.]NIY28899.1 FtsQ-type POTRA domain-containing protein [Fodinibius sp.]
MEDLRWIKRANVKRSWPDKISIEILEYKPVAIWNGRYFITPEGELIEISGDEEYAQSLNQLYGPVGDHVLVMNTYIQLADKLHKNEIYIHKLKLNGRRSIELVLEDDVLIIVGRDNVQSRIDRLINYYDALKAQRVKPIGKIDLRYTNGFSVASNV